MKGIEEEEEDGVRTLGPGPQIGFMSPTTV